MFISVLIVFCCNIFKLISCNQQTYQDFLKDLINSRLYDSRVRPFYGKKHTEINISMFINSISSFNEVDMEYVVDMTFYQEWMDPRLSYENTSWSRNNNYNVHHSLIGKIWKPDTFFRNAKNGKLHKISVPNKLVRVYSNGKIFFSQRLTLNLSCPMKFHKFPLDNQTCFINMGSYGYTTKDLILLWKSLKPVKINLDAYEIGDFSLRNYYEVNCAQETTTGSYACLEVKLYLQRDFGFYFMQIYLPSIIACLVAFLSFYIDQKSAPGRVSINLLTILTLTSQFSLVRSQLPRVPYFTAIDIWMISCLLFGFFSMIEFALVNVALREKEIKKIIKYLTTSKHKKIQDSINVYKQKITHNYEYKSFESTVNNCYLNAREKIKYHKFLCVTFYTRNKAEKIDAISSVIFPSLFLTFNFFYWIYFLTF